MPPNTVQSLCLQPEIKQLLISCVKTRPAIWDSSCEQYNNAGARRRAYAEVAQILGEQNKSHYKPQEIQIEWKKMRDVFNRTLKKVMNSNGRCDISWRYFNDIKFIASPEQLAFIQQRQDDMADDNTSIDPYGIRQFLENSTFNASDENLFEDNDESSNHKISDLDWITSRCNDNQNDNVSNKNDGSSSYDEPLTTTQTDADSAANLDDQMEEEEEEENTSFVPKKRRHNQSNSTSREPRVQHNDTFNAFGLFIASQLRSLSKRNRIAAADLQRSIFEFCLKSELEN